jgi:uncharacterized damage-inducible protein DinB
MNKAFLDVLEGSKEILKQFVEQLTEAEINRRIKDYWTIYEHIDHLVVCQKLYLGRLGQFIKEDNPVMKPFTPEDNPTIENRKSTDRLIADFCALRDNQIKLIKKAKKDVWVKTGKHEEYERYSFEILIRHMILHDSYHMYRMEELWIEKEKYIKELK